MTFLTIAPTTTLAALIANNSSAADSFAGFDNGCAKPANVSKQPRRYANPNLIKLVHRTDWWGSGSHPSIGYSCHDAAYVARTVADMKARGYTGCVLDWYGKGSYEDTSALLMKTECEKQGLKFCIAVDGAVVRNAVQPTVTMNAQLDYVRATFLASPVYLLYESRPVIFFFGGVGVDWSAVRNHVNGFAPNPLLFTRWEEGYGNPPAFDGFYGWDSCSPQWYTDAIAHAASKLVIGGINPGFNNTDRTIISWGTPHIIAQANGDRLKAQIDALNQFPQIGIVVDNTWNDYQEGSEIETGIAGIKITASLSGGKLNITATPGEVIEHIEVYGSFDGVNLALLAALPLGNPDKDSAVLDLVGLDLLPGLYKFFARAVGMNSMQNAMSSPIIAAVSMTVA